MVGSPKHLSDLAKIEADVRITCRRCGFEDDWTQSDLAARLHSIGGSQVWSEITRLLRCRRFGCGSAELRALPVPFARRAANLPRRVRKLDSHLLEVSLAILEKAVSQSVTGAVATMEVRLALLVVHHYVRDAQLARRFWSLASMRLRTVNDSLSEPLAMLRDRLVRDGWIAAPVLLAQDKLWPWNSPAPPGWHAPSWRRREEP